MVKANIAMLNAMRINAVKKACTVKWLKPVNSKALLSMISNDMDALYEGYLQAKDVPNNCISDCTMLSRGDVTGDC